MITVKSINTGKNLCVAYFIWSCYHHELYGKDLSSRDSKPRAYVGGIGVTLTF